MCHWSVGLVQRVIEAAGVPTIALSCIADLTRAVGAPRVAAIEHPLGRPFGLPGDAAGQRAVLAAALAAAETIDAPGGVVELPFRWPEPRGRAITKPSQPPPIVGLLRKKPWLLPKLLRMGLRMGRMGSGCYGWGQTLPFDTSRLMGTGARRGSPQRRRARGGDAEEDVVGSDSPT